MDFPLSDMSLKHESDRGAVLVGVAMLDESLARLLRAAFVNKEPVHKKSTSQLFDANGPLSSFWAKLHFANAIGLLPPKLYADLETIRKLRNRFAHQLDPADFGDKTTQDLVGLLSTTAPLEASMKGGKYLAHSKDGEKISEAQLVQNGYVKAARAVFAACLVVALAQIEGTTETVAKSGIEGGRLLVQRFNDVKKVIQPMKKKGMSDETKAFFSLWG